VVNKLIDNFNNNYKNSLNTNMIMIKIYSIQIRNSINFHRTLKFKFIKSLFSINFSINLEEYLDLKEISIPQYKNMTNFLIMIGITAKNINK